MLHVRMPSGEELASIPAADLSTVRNLKNDLQRICGVPRFRQKLLHGGNALEEDMRLDASMESVLLVLVVFCPASEDEIEELVFSPSQGSVEEVEQILQRSIDPNAATPDGKTALMQASLEGHTEFADLLLEARADLDVSDNDGVTALLTASREGCEDMVQWLLVARADFNKADGNGCTPLVGAFQEGQLHAARLLVQAGAGTGPGPQGNELLYNECAFGHNREVVQLLLEARVDPNTATEDGSTALIGACDEGRPEIVQSLLASDADVNLIDSNGFPALFLASQNKHAEVVRMLVQAGADPDKEIMQTTVLHNACVENSVEVVRWLLHAKAALDQANEDGTTPLNLACSFGHLEIVRLLVEAVADRIGVAGLDRVYGGYTPLHCASIHNYLPVAHLLVEAGASKDITDEVGCIAFDYAKSDDMAKLLATDKPRNRQKGDEECSEAVESDIHGDEDQSREGIREGICGEVWQARNPMNKPGPAEEAARTYVAGLLSPFCRPSKGKQR
ncbi:Ank2 [Symbiodinium natans]|uniref:Ank2 protein n=1 Tax=Symbiodinium natans TaxID=878477 RepID=A0A812LEY4_9DINO|nr:Ank2 [Symbiodinium natans]